jgi:hypothetical protein
MSWRPLPRTVDCAHRLSLIFPRAAFDTVLSNSLATWSVAAMIYVDAIVPADGPVPDDVTWVRPTTVLWLSSAAYERADAPSRAQWRDAALSGNRPKAKVAELLAAWGEPVEQQYADNSRETLRDETWPAWESHGAARIRPGVLTSSSKPRWALTDAFADLFDPDLDDDEVERRIEAFRDTRMDPGWRAKAVVARRREAQVHEVVVKLPDGTLRRLAPGESSMILQGVIEQWAPTRLIDPVVLTISEPGAKYVTADEATMKSLGISLDPAKLLPDAVLVDVGADPVAFWIVEAASSDGEIDDDRKAALLRWAASQNIPAASCHFLSAFASRNAAPAKRRLKDLAAGTFAWYLDEPGHELAWYELET